MRKNRGKYRLFWQIVITFYCGILSAQDPTAPVSPAADSGAIRPLLPKPGINLQLQDSAVVDLKPLRISNQSLDEIIEYDARDSMWFDVTNKQLHLYGEATVKYTSLEVKSGYILLDYGKNEVIATPWQDTSGKWTGDPAFKDRDQSFTASKLRYNFKSQKGIIYSARSRQEDLYVLGQKAKFVGSGSRSDTTANNIIYNQDAIITTCDHPQPHFGIRTKKLKVIPDKLVVTGFSNVEIGGIPTPLVLPFGFYPITKTRKAGLIIPRDFEFSDPDRQGLGIKGWGWYQPINEHSDLTLLFNAYVSGSFGASAAWRYNHKYRYNGNFQIGFNRVVVENNMAQKVAANSYSLRWSHNQDSRAHPTRQINGSINIETNRNQRRNQNDFNSVYQNTLSSNLSFSKRFPGRPFQFNAGFSHSQNTQTRQMNLSLPNATFTMQRIYPFKRKIPSGSERWYEKISLVYDSRLQNSIQVADTLLFTNQVFKNARLGVQHRAATDFNFKLFKYINISPNVNYEENWYPYVIQKRLLEEYTIRRDTQLQNGEIIGINVDTTQYGRVETIRDWKFSAFRQYNAGVSANTALFFTKQFKKGWFRGIRHTLKPSASVGLGPDFSNPRYGYFRTVEQDLRPGVLPPLQYGIFDEGVYSRPSNYANNVIMSYSVGNVLEMKYRNARRDTVLRKRIFDNLVFSGNYNFSADTLKWSTVSTGGLFRLFKGLSNLTWNVSFDPYVLNAKGVKVNRFVVKEEGKLARVSNFNIALNTNFTVRQLREMFEKKDGDANQSSAPPRGEPGDFLSWIDDFQVSHRISLDRRQIIGTNRDTFVIGTNNLSLYGRIPITPKWSFDVSNITYDFQTKSLVYPDIGISRDLHCWQMSLSWQPVRRTYQFFITVKPGTLDFLKLPYRKNNFDNKDGF